MPRRAASASEVPPSEPAPDSATSIGGTSSSAGSWPTASDDEADGAKVANLTTSGVVVYFVVRLVVVVVRYLLDLLRKHQRHDRVHNGRHGSVEDSSASLARRPTMTPRWGDGRRTPGCRSLRMRISSVVAIPFAEPARIHRNVPSHSGWESKEVSVVVAAKPFSRMRSSFYCVNVQHPDTVLVAEIPERQVPHHAGLCGCADASRSEPLGDHVQQLRAAEARPLPTRVRHGALSSTAGRLPCGSASNRSCAARTASTTTTTVSCRRV
jgi:hypothetical protein